MTNSHGKGWKYQKNKNPERTAGYAKTHPASALARSANMFTPLHPNLADHSVIPDSVTPWFDGTEKRFSKTAWVRASGYSLIHGTTEAATKSCCRP
uniref:Uncharacterized protein n=1 Tax=Candidatus Kentrum sp. LFY TaxID=2126342 RepID=A0A450V2Q7_9GAMM|nr:MAG: hypothetical protein BECKLFY1418B_GA0070995_11357 [Candidatus Kentron sp. LFY]